MTHTHTQTQRQIQTHTQIQRRRTTRAVAGTADRNIRRGVSPASRTQTPTRTQTHYLATELHISLVCLPELTVIACVTQTLCKRKRRIRVQEFACQKKKSKLRVSPRVSVNGNGTSKNSPVIYCVCMCMCGGGAGGGASSVHVRIGDTPELLAPLHPPLSHPSCLPSLQHACDTGTIFTVGNDAKKIKIKIKIKTPLTLPPLLPPFPLSV